MTVETPLPGAKEARSGYVPGSGLGAVCGALPGAAKAALQVVATGDGVLVPLVYACLPTGPRAHNRREVAAAITPVDQRQPVEPYHPRWAGDLRAVPQNDPICTHR